MITALTKDTFERFVQSSEPVLVDFWAEWCGPCRMQGEVLHALDEAHASLQIGKVNVDECGDLAAHYGIEAIPTMLLFRKGEVIEQLVGLRQAEALLELFRKHGASL